MSPSAGLILCLVLPAALAFTNYETCNRGGGMLPDFVEMSGCEEAPCEIYEGDELVTTAGFRAPYPSSNLTTRVDIYKLGIRVEFNLPPQAVIACDFLIKGECPIRGGEELLWGFNEIFEGVPVTASVNIEFSLQDDGGRNMVCARFPAKFYKHPRPETK